jgi:hypothetical protein
MTTAANMLTLMGMSLIRFGGRGGGGFAFLLFGLLVIGIVVWALTRPSGNNPAPPVRPPNGSSPAAGAQE